MSTRMKPAKPSPSSAAKPRQRATTITTAAKISPTTSSGVLRLKSENWYWAGWSPAGGTRTNLMTWPTFDPRRVDRAVTRHRHGLAFVVALQQLGMTRRRSGRRSLPAWILPVPHRRSP